MATDADILFMHNNGYSHAAIAEQLKQSPSAVRGRLSRARRTQSGHEADRIIRDEPTPLIDELQELRREIALLRNQLNEQEDERLYGHDLGKPWRFEGDAIIAGDIHLNTTKMDLFERLLQIAKEHLKPPRRFVIAGDLFNADAFSSYPAITPYPSFPKELRAGRHFIDMALQVMGEINVILGNHDRRIQKSTANAIAPEDLMRIISHDPRVKVSQWGHCVLTTVRGDYRITHGSEYSVNQLTVADQLAQKYGQHIISWHEHHTAVGLDRFKKYIIVNGGGLFDSDSMAYTQLDDNKKPRMANGFVLVKRGYPHVFNDLWTDWSMWIDEDVQELQKSA